jgi:hypothetical protein
MLESLVAHGGELRWFCYLADRSDEQQMVPNSILDPKYRTSSQRDQVIRLFRRNVCGIDGRVAIRFDGLVIG